MCLGNWVEDRAASSVHQTPARFDATTTTRADYSPAVRLLSFAGNLGHRYNAASVTATLRPRCLLHRRCRQISIVEFCVADSLLWLQVLVDAATYDPDRIQ